MVSSYLVHHGYSSTAEAFSKATGQTISEDITSIKNRQSQLITNPTKSASIIDWIISLAEILKLVLSGRMGQAIEQTIRSYPGLFDTNQDLLFILKCRQFIEMVNGSDFEVISHRTKLIILLDIFFFDLCKIIFLHRHHCFLFRYFIKIFNFYSFIANIMLIRFYLIALIGC